MNFRFLDYEHEDEDEQNFRLNLHRRSDRPRTRCRPRYRNCTPLEPLTPINFQLIMDVIFH